MHIFCIFVQIVEQIMKRIAVFASGSGSNAENIANHFNKSQEIEVALILSNKSDAYVHERARQLNIPSYTFSKKELDKGTVVVDFLREQQIDFIVLAGFLLKVSEVLIDAYPQRIINIHPALLPKFCGKGMYGHHVHTAVIEAGEKESGITIHYINEYYDEGATIFQASCPVLKDDTPDSLAQRVQALEYLHFPTIIEEVCKKHC